MGSRVVLLNVAGTEVIGYSNVRNLPKIFRAKYLNSWTVDVVFHVLSSFQPRFYLGLAVRSGLELL